MVVEYEKCDRYERILGKVLLNGEDMNLEQIKAGLAWHCKKYQEEQATSDRVKFPDAELDARSDRRGLWHGPTPVAPWEYRQAKRQKMKALQSFTGNHEVR